MSVTQVGTPAAPAVASASNTMSVTPSLGSGQTDAAGDLLVVVVTAFGASSVTAISGPSGWTNQAAVSAGSNLAIAVFTKVAAGSDALGPFTATGTGTASHARITAELFQLHGQDGTTPVIGAATATGTTGNVTVTATAATPDAGCVAIAGYAFGSSSSGTLTYTPGSGFTNVANTGSTSTYAHSAFDTRTPASGETTSDAGTHSGTATTAVAAAIIVVQDVQPAVKSGSDSGHGAEVIAPPQVNGAGSGHGTEAFTLRQSGADWAHGTEAAYSFGGDWSRTAEASAVRVLASGSAHGTEGSSGQAAVAGAGSVHGTEASSLRLSGADSGHGTETGSVSGPSSPVTGADSGQGTAAGSVQAAVSGSGSGHGAETGSVRVSGSGSAQGAETGSVRVSGADSVHGAGAGSVQGAGSRADSAHGAETGSVQASAAGSGTGHGAESSSLTVSVNSADTALGTEAAAASGGQHPVAGSDAARATESAFYYLASTDAASGGDAPGVVRTVARDTARADGRSLSSWPYRGDSAGSRDVPDSAWPAGDDTGRAAEAVRKFSFALSDEAAALEVLHEMGIYPFIPVNVRLLGKIWRVTALGADGTEVVIFEGERLTGQMLATAEQVSWARGTRTVRKVVCADLSRAAEASRPVTGVTCWIRPAVQVTVTVVVLEPVR